MQRLQSGEQSYICAGSVAWRRSRSIFMQTRGRRICSKTKSGAEPKELLAKIGASFMPDKKTEAIHTEGMIAENYRSTGR